MSRTETEPITCNINVRSVLITVEGVHDSVSLSAGGSSLLELVSAVTNKTTIRLTRRPNFVDIIPLNSSEIAFDSDVTDAEVRKSVVSASLNSLPLLLTVNEMNGNVTVKVSDLQYSTKNVMYTNVITANQTIELGFIKRLRGDVDSSGVIDSADVKFICERYNEVVGKKIKDKHTMI